MGVPNNNQEHPETQTSLYEEEEESLQVHEEGRNEAKAHVFDILDFNERAVAVLDSQGINTLQHLLSIRRNIYDGMVS